MRGVWWVIIMFPTKRPTPSEYAVIAVMISAVFIVLGVITLVVAFRADTPEKHIAAVQLMRYGWWSLGSGVLVGFAFWLVRRFTR